MDYDEAKVDEATLALLFLVMFTEGDVTRAWKGFDWAALNRLHDKGWIGNPKSKAKSVMVTEEGRRLAEQLFAQHFGATP
jgi:hypothetical protein